MTKFFPYLVMPKLLCEIQRRPLGNVVLIVLAVAVRYDVILGQRLLTWVTRSTANAVQERHYLNRLIKCPPNLDNDHDLHWNVLHGRAYQKELSAALDFLENL
jgi:hypothetical protein